jgi:hypothetical protein
MSTLTISPSFTARPVRRPADRSHASGQMRLTRRGRLVLFLLALGVVLALGVAWGSGSVATDRPGTPEPTQIVHVAPGDTLFAIAESVTTDGDVAAMVEHIQQLNALDDATLYAGQALRVPVDR